MIRFNDFKRQWRDVSRDVLLATEEVGESGFYILGEQVRAFEGNLAQYWKRRESVGVASGLDALEIALRVLGCGERDLVLTSPISAFATVLAIIKTGAVPVFADCDDYGLVDLNSCRDILKQQPTIRYFVPVHLYGHSLDLRGLRSLRDEFELKIVEDCAQSIGAAFDGAKTASVGDFAATSFYPTKNLGAMGDGGAILTDSSEYATLARRLRDYGQTRKYWHELIGYNSRLDELQAAFLNRAFLPRLDAWIERRRNTAKRYLEEIRNPGIHVPGSPRESNSSWHLFPILVSPERKSEFMAYLRSMLIETAEHYPSPLHKQPALSNLSLEHESLTNAERFCRGEVSLPIHPYLTEEEISGVIQAANAWN